MTGKGKGLKRKRDEKGKGWVRMVMGKERLDKVRSMDKLELGKTL